MKHKPINILGIVFCVLLLPIAALNAAFAVKGLACGRRGKIGYCKHGAFPL